MKRFMGAPFRSWCIRIVVTLVSFATIGATLSLAVPFWTRRLLVKPCITGWAQLRCGYAYDTDSTAEKLSYDLWYLRNRNVVVDLAICAKTVSTLLFRPGR